MRRRGPDWRVTGRLGFLSFGKSSGLDFFETGRRLSDFAIRDLRWLLFSRSTPPSCCIALAGYHVEEIELSLDVSVTGEVSLILAGAEVEGAAGIKLTLKRKQAN